MANVDLNAITEHFRGKVGDLVFRRSNGRLQAMLRPRPTRTPPTEAQLAHRVDFQRAILYAKKALAAPETRAVYERVGEMKQQNAFSAAVGDFFRPPVVLEIKTDAYHGQVGDPIEILAKDDVEVMSVAVKLMAADGTVVESGPATFALGAWTYVGSTALAAGAAITIEVTATDRPGNTGVLTKVYP